MDAPRAKGTPFSLPPHLYPDEVLDDLTISPYASYTSLSEPRPAVLSGWLDKLSPQGYVLNISSDGSPLLKSLWARLVRWAPHLWVSRSHRVLLGSWCCKDSCALSWGLCRCGVCVQLWGTWGTICLLTARFSALPTGTMSSRGAMSVLMGRT